MGFEWVCSLSPVNLAWPDLLGCTRCAGSLLLSCRLQFVGGNAELLWSRRDCLRARATSYSHPTLDHSLFRQSLHKIPGPGQHAHPVYWTLSHRWGDPEKVFQLRHSTESSFRNGIALEQLSPTFRDAAPLVHGLGLQHIWIDSLCIFQDSLADSQCEASTMSDVYHHSSCKSPPQTHHTDRPPLTLVCFTREEPTPDYFIRSKQALGEENARRKARQQRRRNQHQERLKHHKRRLVLHNMVAPAASHLGNTVNTPNENSCVRPHHHIHKHPEIAVPPERYALRPLRRRAISHPFPHTDEVLPTDNAKYPENNKLQE